MSVTKRIFSLFLLVLMLLLIQHVISGRIQDNCNGKSTSQSCHSACQHLHVRSVAKVAAKKKTPVQNYLSIIFLTIIPFIAHLKFDFADIFFAITHVPVYRWQLARCDLSKTPVYRTNDEI